MTTLKKIIKELAHKKLRTNTKGLDYEFAKFNFKPKRRHRLDFIMASRNTDSNPTHPIPNPRRHLKGEPHLLSSDTSI